MQHLKELGATQVVTYDELLTDKSFRDRVKQWTGGNVGPCFEGRSPTHSLPLQGIRLMLNCVSGETTTAAVSLLGQDAHLVSYGAMSKQPLSLPTSTFIFKNLTCHGFWQSRWYQHKSKQGREDLMRVLSDMKVRLLSGGGRNDLPLPRVAQRTRA